MKRLFLLRLTAIYRWLHSNPLFSHWLFSIFNNFCQNVTPFLESLHWDLLRPKCFFPFLFVSLMKYFLLFNYPTILLLYLDGFGFMIIGKCRELWGSRGKREEQNPVDPSVFKVYHGIDAERQILPHWNNGWLYWSQNAVIIQESCMLFSRLP